MRTQKFLLLLALAGIAGAQTLVGLPQYGVVLEGKPWDPVVVNNSGKSIIGWVIYLTDETGTERYATHNALFPNGKPVPPGGRMDMFASGGGKAAIGVGTPTGSFPASIIVKKAIIDAVIFESGLYVGPDHERNFDAMQKRMAAHRRGESPEAMGQLARARDLDGEAEAIKLREHYRSLPVLHKEERNAQ